MDGSFSTDKILWRIEEVCLDRSTVVSTVLTRTTSVKTQVSMDVIAVVGTPIAPISIDQNVPTFPSKARNTVWDYMAKLVGELRLMTRNALPSNDWVQLG